MMRLLSLRLLLIIHVVCSEPCRLCQDGSEIGRPDFVLGITEPISLKTCADLSLGLSFVDAGSASCKDSRDLAVLCGCPPPLESCSICGDASIVPQRPQQVLDGLVEMVGELLGRSSNGIARTCAYVDSIVRQYQADESVCLELPFDDLQRYCGCPKDDGTTEEDEACTLCPGGEIVPDEGNEIHFTLFGDTVSCSEAQQIVTQIEKGSDTCNAIQQVGTVCGCPVPENSCHLCKNGGTMADGNTTYATSPYTGDLVSCNTLEAQLRSFTANSSECTSLDDNYAEQCGCITEEEFVPCTICPRGEPVPFPDKYIEGIEDLGFDSTGYSCGITESIAMQVAESSGLCKSIRLAAKLCGCQSLEHSCSICGTAGQTMANPFNEAVFNFGSTTDLFSDFEGATVLGVVDVGREYSCELADSAYAFLYTDNDSWCYWNQMMRADFCGCTETSDATKLLWAQKVSGILSLVGSLCIILVIMRKRRILRFSIYNQIVLFISFFDILSSIAYIIGTSFTPSELGLPGSIGTDGTCKFQAWLFQMGFTSVLYNVVLCVYFLLVVKYNWTNRRFKKVSKAVHLSTCLLGLGASVAVIPFAVPDWRWCYLGTPPQSDSWLPGVFLFIAPVAVCILAMTILTAVFIGHVRRTSTQGASHAFRVDSKQAKINFIIQRCTWQSIYFLLAFYMVWPIQFAAFIVPTVPSNYWVFFSAAIFGPLQGLLNALVYFSRERRGAQHMLSLWTKRLKSSCTCSKRRSSQEEPESAAGEESDAHDKSSQSVVVDESSMKLSWGAKSLKSTNSMRSIRSIKSVRSLKSAMSIISVQSGKSRFGDEQPFECEAIFERIGAEAGANNGILEHAIHAGMLDNFDVATILEGEETQIVQDQNLGAASFHHKQDGH